MELLVHRKKKTTAVARMEGNPQTTTAATRTQETRKEEPTRGNPTC
jgi:hypothetical protein